MHGTAIIPSGVSSYQYGRHRSPSKSTSSWLNHVDGIRGLAIFLVVIFHVFVGKVSSGVDVFLFLGGMFLLSSQMRNAFSPHGLSLTQSLIRLMRRLYPALILVVTVTGVLGLFIYSSTKWDSLLKDMAASASYWVNFRLWHQGNDYTTAGDDPSPFQHLWSMSAQIQIYLAIILVVTFIGVIKKKRNSDSPLYGHIAVGVVATATVASFIYAWWLGTQEQSLNYYSSLSRFWEIGAGALFGHLLLNRIVFHRTARWVLSIAGLMAILFTGVFLDGANQFPGPLTLIPIIGAALIVSSGRVHDDEDRSWKNIGPIFLLETKIARELGRISYSLYLWHWALLILAVSYFGELNWWIGLGVIISSLGLAWVTSRYVEDTFRQKNKPKRMTIMEIVNRSYMIRLIRTSPSLVQPIGAVIAIVAGMLILVSPGIYQAGSSIQAGIVSRDIERRGGIDTLYPGAGAFLANREFDAELPVTPEPSVLSDMMPASQKDGCYSNFESSDLVLESDKGMDCVYGDTESTDTMYVIGGSHSEHYLSALDAIGEERGFAVRVIVKMGCAPYQPTLYDGTEYEECQEWTDKLVDYIIETPPTLGIFMTGSRPEHLSGKGPEIVPEDYINVVRTFSDNGIHSWLIRDNPWMIEDPEKNLQKDARTCVNEAQSSGDKDPSDCGQPWEWTMNPQDPQVAAYAGIPNVTLMDAHQSYTRDGYVYPVVGGFLVYRDTHHLTQQFVSTMAGYLDTLMFPEPEKIMALNN